MFVLHKIHSGALIPIANLQFVIPFVISAKEPSPPFISLISPLKLSLIPLPNLYWKVDFLMSGIFYGGLPRESVIVVVPSVIRVNTTFSFNEYIAKDKYI